MASSSTVVKQLQNLHLFRNVSAKDLTKLTQMCQILEFRPRQVIFAQNAPADHAMILVSGKLDVCILTGHTEDIWEAFFSGAKFLESLDFFTAVEHALQWCEPIKTVSVLLVTPELMRETWNNEAIVALEQFLIATMARRIRNTNLEIQKIWKVESADQQKADQKTHKHKNLNNLVDSWANSNHSLEENKMQTDDLRIVARKLLRTYQVRSTRSRSMFWHLHSERDKKRSGLRVI